MKIEAGKYYRTRDGRKVGPIKRGNSNNPAWYWAAPQLPDELCGSEWHEDGQFWPEGHTNWTKTSSGLDLIAEWTDGPVRTVTRTVTETTIEPGHYAGLKVDLSPAKGFVCVGIGMDSRLWSATELKAAAAVLLELAGALDSE